MQCNGFLNARFAKLALGGDGFGAGDAPPPGIFISLSLYLYLCLCMKQNGIIVRLNNLTSELKFHFASITLDWGNKHGKLDNI